MLLHASSLWGPMHVELGMIDSYARLPGARSASSLAAAQMCPHKRLPILLA